MARNPESHDTNLERFDPDQQAALQNLRSLISKIVPDAVEYISYGITAFRCNGKILVVTGYQPNTVLCTFSAHPF